MALPPPSDAEVERVAARTAHCIARLRPRRGLVDADPAASDPLVREDPLLAELASASLQGRSATSGRVRPPIATDRLSRLPGGNLSYRLRHAWRDGTSCSIHSS